MSFCFSCLDVFITMCILNCTVSLICSFKRRPTSRHALRNSMRYIVQTLVTSLVLSKILLSYFHPQPPDGINLFESKYHQSSNYRLNHWLEQWSRASLVGINTYHSWTFNFAYFTASNIIFATIKIQWNKSA